MRATAGLALLAMSGLFLVACGDSTPGSTAGAAGAGGAQTGGTGETATGGTAGQGSGGAAGASAGGSVGTGGSSTGGTAGAPTGGSSGATGGGATGGTGGAAGSASGGAAGRSSGGAGGAASGGAGGAAAAGTGGAAAAGTGGAAAAGAGGSTTDAGMDVPLPAPTTTISTSPIDFGGVDCGAAGGALPFSFTNTGNAVLHYRASIDLGGLFSLQGAASDGSVSGDVNPGSSAMLTVLGGIVPTSSVSGAVLQGLLTVTTNAAGAGNTQIPLTMTAQGSACALTCGSLTECTPSNSSPYCADLSTDGANCGTCGTTCSFPQGSAECSGGACFMTGCQIGYQDCNLVDADGCESNQNTDLNNCGSCGHVCNIAGGETCVAGACTCGAGWSSCNGVCIPTSDDPNNCGGCGIACGMPTSAALDSGLIGRWHLDEGSGTTSADSSGNGNAATLSGATWTTGYSGEALAGDGSSSYVSANLGSYFGTNNALTASAWVYATATTNGPIFGVSAILAGGSWNMPFLSIAGPTAYGWLWGVPGTDSASSPLAATVSLDAWHFLAITYTPSGGSGTEKFYVDGALAGTATGAYQPSGLVDRWTTTIPGAKPTAVTNSFLDGQVDEVRAYSRALSGSEISILYNARQTCSSSTCGCTGGESLCGGDCTDKTIDANNCGACGTTCNAAGGESCLASSCGCASGTDCSGTCIDTTSDPNNCGGCGTPCDAVTCASCDSGMAGLWHLDEGSGGTSADSSGNGNGATLNLTPTWVAGASGEGLTFDGTSSLTAKLGSWFGANNPLSASAWVYATATTNGPIFGVTDTLPGTGWNMPFLSISGSTVYGWLWSMTNNNPLSATVTLNAWHLLTITYDPNGGGPGVGQEIFYVDGTVASSAAITYWPSGKSDFLTTQIQGAKPSTVTNNVLNGTIDELRAYTRALSAGEIALLYNARQVCTGSVCAGCPAGTTSCGGGVCQNTACGACGSPCSGAQQCVAGTCM